MMNEVGAVSDPRQEDDVSEGSVCGAMGPRQWRRVCREQQEQEREYEQRIGQATAALLAVQRSEAALQEKLRAHAAARPTEIARHNAMADELRAAKDELIKKNNELTRIKGQLSWGRNEARINEIIQRLEGQLRCNNYSLREENKIVAEINALKRSKSVIGTFNAVEAEVLKLREKENKLRRESSMDHDKFKKDMAKNAELVADSMKNLKRMAELQKELEQLRSGLGDLRAMFEKRRASYEQHMEEQRRVRPATPTQPAAATITPAVPPPRPKPRRAPPAQTQTHSQCEEELRLISTLIVYLRKFVPHYRESEESTKQQQQQQQASEPVAVEGMRVLKKEDQEEMLFTGNGKKNKKEKKRNNIKRMSHHSEVLQQFARLGLNPPNTSAEAEQAMKQLVQKKYDLTLPGGASHLPRLQINSTTSTSPPAPAMASGGSGSLTDGDSIITTPDNMLLRQPDFERGRRDSQDSGLVVEGEGGEKEGGDDEVTEAGENGAGQGDGGEKGEESPIASEENGSGSGDGGDKEEVDHEVAEAGENEGAKDNGKKEMEMSQGGEKGNNEEVVVNTAASQDAKDSGEKSEEQEMESQGGENEGGQENSEEEKVIESGVNQDTKDSDKEVLENIQTDSEVIEAEEENDTNTFDTNTDAEESQKTTASEVEQVEGEIETNPVDDETERLRTESTSTLQAEEESEVTPSRKESSSDESSNLDDCDADADASASSEDEVIEYKPSEANVPQPEERESETESTNEVVGTEEVPQQDEKESETEITNEVMGTEEETSKQEVSIPLASQACSTDGSEKNDECDSDVESKAESTPSICLSEDEFPAIGQDEGANVGEVMANNQSAPKLTWAKIVARPYMKMKVRSKPAHSAEVVSNTAVVVSNTAEVVSNAAEAVSNTAEVVSTKEEVSNTAEVVSNTTEVVSNTEEVSSAEEAVSSMQEVVLNSPCDSSPDSDGASESLDRCESASVANEKAESVRSEPVEESAGNMEVEIGSEDACEETVASENGDNPEEQESKCDAEDEKIVVEDVQQTGACNLEASAPESRPSEPKPASQYKVFTVSFTGKFHMVCDEEVSLQEATQQVEHSLLRAFPSSETWGHNQYQIRVQPLDTSEEHEVCVKNFH